VGPFAVEVQRGILSVLGKRSPQLKSNAMNKEEILKKLAAGELEVEAASKLLAEIEQPKRGSLYCKVSEKGAVSVYGLQRMPVTLYMEQWDRLLGFAEELRAFIKEHDGELKRKEK
jgi:hypothetical protein